MTTQEAYNAPQDPLILLRHDMAPRNPYDASNAIAHCVNPPPDHSHPRQTLITELPQPKLVYPPPNHKETVDDRNRRRYENTRGTLGGNVNFDGTKREKPMISMEHYKLAEESRRLNQSNPELIYFGSATGYQQQRERESFRHKPGIMSVLYSDSDSNLERKRVIKDEMAKYERMQTEERDRRLQQERHQQSPPKDNWPFGKHLGHGSDHLTFNHVIPLRQEEIAMREQEKKLAMAYAKELDNQIENDRKYREQMKKSMPVRDDEQTWMFHHNHMPGRRPKVPFEPPRDSATDLISHVPHNHQLQADKSRKLRPPLQEERKDYNKSHPPQPDRPLPPVEPTSLVLGSNKDRRVSFPDEKLYHEPQFGRRKFLLNSTNEEQKMAEHEMKLMRDYQEKELRLRREMEQKEREEAFSQGKAFAHSYPWKWGDHGGQNPHHKVTDILQHKEPLDRNKALQYQADLDAMVRHKRDNCQKEKQREVELWNRHNQNSFENALGKNAHHGGPRHQALHPKGPAFGSL
ncbi:hypothetical protein BCR33DRAFT_721738 [Rhizoclosmatium globosum]|uniref:Uncharacterized protein n=1 Tax=Rhizoclosmatium globosum TaxID=329046 RepID=A0A1Y2BSL5_9FUNG|nr:hypothetical protein BCR33DRAFT_721738 [Rhizoclosmatium globosum]|eukprot:ORY37115.1 hypothetical protein BCR33DRAFT_721738 [Rhizoclosmatium globosum]